MARRSHDEFAAARADRIEAAQAVLADAVAAIRDGEDWKRFLGFQARLHSYSANNCLLLIIAHQRLYEQRKVSTPVPTYVASYRRWQELGRQVQRGQTGMAIIAPMRGMYREAIDAGGKTRRLGRGERPADGEIECARPYMRGFTVEKAFSSEQTVGTPLPAPPQPTLLSGEAPAGLGEAVLRLIEDHGFSVTTVLSADALNGANGVTRWDSRQVLIRADMDDAAMVKTLLHEGAHVLLHDPTSDEPGAVLPRGHKEVEAESVAFVVARAHGMPTDEYSFPYVAAWAGDEPDQAIAKTAQRVANCARQLIVISPAVHVDGGRPAPSRVIGTTSRAAPDRTVAALRPTDAAMSTDLFAHEGMGL